MLKLLAKSLTVWLVFAVTAVLNGIVREGLLAELVGRKSALPLSGILLATLLFVITLATIRFLDPRRAGDAWMIGAFWLTTTLAFEFLFGHFVLGHTLDQLLSAFDPANGNLWTLVLFTTLIAPFLAGKTRGLF